MSTTRTRVAGVAVLALLVTGCGASPADTGAPAASSSDSPSASASSGQDAGATPANGRSVPAPRGAGASEAPMVAKALRPRQIAIPAIGVDASITSLGIRKDGAIEVPSDARQTGWLTSTPAPGQQGPAVVAGHVDSTTGPAVFYDLRDLEVGDAITITLRNGSSVDFTVDGVERYPQDDFPTATVYGPVPGPALRLITCGGDYIKSEGGYQDNVVVYAS